MFAPVLASLHVAASVPVDKNGMLGKREWDWTPQAFLTIIHSEVMVYHDAMQSPTAMGEWRRVQVEDTTGSI